MRRASHQTALDQRSYSTARSYALKAETSLTHISGTGNKAAKAEAQPAALPGMLSTGSKREEEQRSKHFQLLREKISVAVSVAELGTSEFARAARGFLNASPPPPVSAMGAAPSTSSGRDNSATNTAHFISSGDIGLYGVLCGMATMDRDQFKRLVLDNVTLRPFLEHTPFLKELILLYHNSKFLAALQLLEHNMARLILDIHLSRHVNRLLGMIKDRMVQFYLTPFRAVKIDKMAGAFGWDAGVTEMEVIRLVEDGKVQVRVDTRDRVSWRPGWSLVWRCLVPDPFQPPIVRRRPCTLTTRTSAMPCTARRSRSPQPMTRPLALWPTA